MGSRALQLICCFALIAGIRGVAAAAGEDGAAAKIKAAPLADIAQNGTRNGEGNGKIYVQIGGSAAFASSTDGSGNGNTSGGSGNNNGNRATGNGNGNGNGNNNAQITIVNDPAFLTCPPCQYYDPSTQLCITVQSCVNSKPTTPATASPPAGTISVGGTASAASTALPVTAGRKLRM